MNGNAVRLGSHGSPDLGVLDYAVWKELSRRMWAQEKRWPKSYRESCEDYIKRSRKTAMSLPKKFVEDSIGDMTRKCQRFHVK